MTQGRRAADRRRERGDNDQHFDDDDVGTTPGAVPASPHDDYEEIDDETGIGVRPRTQASMLVDSGLMAEGPDGPDPGVSSSKSARPTRTAQSSSVRERVEDDDVADAEKSFRRELKRRPSASPTRVTAPLEKTEVKELKARRPRPGGQLTVVASESQPVGSILPIAVYPTLLGRSRDADLVVADPTVSLRHVELALDEEGFTLLDLGSTSGTLVNGLVVDGRTRLLHGDIVALGKTELRFGKTETAPSPRPVPEPEVPDPAAVAVVEGTERSEVVPDRTSTTLRQARDHQQRKDRAALEAHRAGIRKKALSVIGASLVIFAVVAFGFFVYRTAFSDSAPAQIRHQVAVLLGEAKKQLHTGDVDGAAARVSTILGLDPGNAEAKSLDRQVSTEKSARDALQLALRLGDEDRDLEALDALARIANTSVFVRDRDRLRQALAERALVRSLRAVENLLDQGRVADALARAEDHVRRFPKDPGGQALLARVQGVKVGEVKDPALGPARAAFANGDVEGARRIADAAGYRGYVADLDRFAENLAQGKEALKRFDAQQARGPLDEAFRLLGSLGASSTSTMFASVQKPYADALYLHGTEQMELGDGCSAARDFFKGARVLPGDPRLNGELQKLQARADQGLQKARGAKAQDPDRAAALAREALCFAKSGSPVWTELRAIAQ